MSAISQQLRNLRIAGILDELSCFCFPYECRFLNLDIFDWKEALETFQPQMLFVESAWHGVSNHWYRKVYTVSVELRDLTLWCKQRNIPTVFWNKEDPVHFDTFLGAAGLFDYVYTTDMDCVPLYKRLLGHSRVGTLPFAVCTQTFNPIEKYERKSGCCFAGGYYALQKERSKDLETLFDACSDLFSIDIYDRNVYPGNPDYTFPEKYQKHIVGSLPMNKIDVAYKGYMWGITLNTVKNSSTMQARRIFELLACNTLSISNPCVGITNLLGDLVISYTDDESFQNRIHLLQDQLFAEDKLKLQALRKVLTQHTYYERIKTLVKDVLFWDLEDAAEEICVYSVVSSQAQIDAVMRSFERQAYPNKTLVFVVEHDGDYVVSDEATLIYLNSEQFVSEIKKAEWYAYFSPDHYYGVHYLTDLSVSLTYSSASAIGKGCYFSNDRGTYEQHECELKYQMTDSLKIDRSIINARLARNMHLSDAVKQGAVVDTVACLSIDPFHFCENEPGMTCEIVEDIPLACGKHIDEIYRTSQAIAGSRFYTMQKHQSGKEFLKDAVIDAQCVQKTEFVDESAGLFCIASDGKKSYMRLTPNFGVKEYDRDGWIRVYLDYRTQGCAMAAMVYLDDKEQTIRVVNIQPKMYLRIPVPDNACKLYFRAVMEEGAALLFNEMAMNAFPLQNIGMSRSLEVGL